MIVAILIQLMWKLVEIIPIWVDNIFYSVISVTFCSKLTNLYVPFIYVNNIYTAMKLIKKIFHSSKIKTDTHTHKAALYKTVIDILAYQ